MGGYFSSTNSYGLFVSTNPVDNNTLREVMQLTRNTQGVAANGIGVSMMFNIEPADGGQAVESGRFGIILTDAVLATLSSAFVWLLRNNGIASSIEVMRLTGLPACLMLNPAFQLTAHPLADGTYTVGIGSTQNGTITTKGGIITAIQEAI